MPTFNSPTADAAEASEALRGLAHASRVFEDPADTYTVLGDLLAGVRSLRQVFDQLATVHAGNQVRAYDDAGNQGAGASHALIAAARLRQAAVLLDGVHEQVDAAIGASGHIAWRPAPSDSAPARWVGVVFLQGQDADAVLAIIDRDGADAAIEYLVGFDMGEETTQAALVNGYVYDTIPAGPLDRTTSGSGGGEYTLTYNHDHGHVSLLRTPAEPREGAAETRAVKRTPVRQPAQVPEDEDDPFAQSRSSSMLRGRSL